mmetsp:Transcript_37009/g.115826  ORF Transcript_37009/g.115826 Transcript_37009/m.115826 type:complete len:113 (-) Transcript_37009:90-428(-)
MHEHLSASRPAGRGRAASPSEEGTLSPSSGASRCDELRRGLRDEVAKLVLSDLRIWACAHVSLQCEAARRLARIAGPSPAAETAPPYPPAAAAASATVTVQHLLLLLRAVFP